MGSLKEWIYSGVLFLLLATLNFTVLSFANEAREEARTVRTELERINVPAQNRCIVRVILSYPPPITEDQHDVVLDDYDSCIDEEAGDLSPGGGDS